VNVTTLPKKNEPTPTLGRLSEKICPERRFLDALSPDAVRLYLAGRAQIRPDRLAVSAARIAKELEFERAFVKAAGLLMAGCDPTGNGSALAGFGDQRNLELLVQGGSTPLKAIRIATLNGAKFLGLDGSIGSISVGKQPYLVVIDGNPAAHISDVKKTKLVFKDGVGYDPSKLLESIRGQAGLH